MSDVPSNPAQLIVLAAIEALPDVLHAVKDIFKKSSPDAPPPSDMEVLQALDIAFVASLAKDDQWLAAHPEESEPST